MTHRRLLTLLLALLAAAAVAVQGAAADDDDDDDNDGGKRHGKNKVVFVQTNEPAGNRILVFDAARDGRLTSAGSYPTGGNGEFALPGTESDTLASQGSLVYDSRHRLLFAVNAGSNTVSVFSVRGNRLELEDVDPSGGQFPASIAVRGRLVYVLNAGGTGIVQGFRIDDDRLRPISGSARSLGLANTDPPNFLTSPGQVGFTPDGRQLIVTTKASRSTIDVFRVGRDGRLSETAVLNPSATPVPFAFTFAPKGRLVVGEAGASTVTTYELERDGMLTEPKSQPDGQAALCWIQRVGEYYYVSNTGSNTLSAYRISRDGQPSLVGPTGVVATTTPGPIDMTSPSRTSLLYAQTGSGSVHGYRVNRDGSLTEVGVVSGLPVGMEGIAST
jgi:6-phosphogluconolactonase (cycloisomerase 2 family)